MLRFDETVRSLNLPIDTTGMPEWLNVSILPLGIAWLAIISAFIVHGVRYGKRESSLNGLFVCPWCGGLQKSLKIPWFLPPSPIECPTCEGRGTVSDADFTACVQQARLNAILWAPFPLMTCCLWFGAYQQRQTNPLIGVVLLVIGFAIAYKGVFHIRAGLRPFARMSASK